jgi:hypothetical protein
LAEARKKKIDQYDSIVNGVKIWHKKIEENRIRHKVSNINVDCKFIVISKEIERNMCSLIDSNKKERLRYRRV